jgi:hypothetical protein
LQEICRQTAVLSFPASSVMAVPVIPCIVTSVFETARHRFEIVTSVAVSIPVAVFASCYLLAVCSLSPRFFGLEYKSTFRSCWLNRLHCCPSQLEV